MSYQAKPYGLRLITLTEALVILDITETESNNFFLLYTERKRDVIFFAS